LAQLLVFVKMKTAAMGVEVEQKGALRQVA